MEQKEIFILRREKLDKYNAVATKEVYRCFIDKPLVVSSVDDPKVYCAVDEKIDWFPIALGDLYILKIGDV